MKLKVFLVGVICLTVFALVANAQEININTVPSIQVTGKAEVKAAPDTAIFSLVVEKVDMDLKKAKAENDKSVSQILAIAKKYDISNNDVKTDYISVSKEYESVPVGNGKTRQDFKGFEVSKTVIIRLTDISKFEAIFTDLLTTGISRANRVQFETSEIRKYKDEARLLAIKAAKEKADAVAGGLGQTVGKAISIDIEPQRGGYYSTNNNISSNEFSVGSSSETSSNTFAPGMITITAEVEVKFLLN